jgi:hypothetical protein
MDHIKAMGLSRDFEMGTIHPSWKKNSWADR